MSGDSVRRRTFLPELTEAIDESVTRRYSAAASMIMALIDTTFLIDLMKEAKKSIAGSATIKLDDLIQRREALRIVEQVLSPLTS